MAKYWNSSGVPKEKLIIGLATYGRTFTLSGSQTGIGAAASGPGIKGQYTREAGVISYYEVFHFILFSLSLFLAKTFVNFVRTGLIVPIRT